MVINPCPNQGSMPILRSIRKAGKVSDQRLGITLIPRPKSTWMPILMKKCIAVEGDYVEKVKNWQFDIALIKNYGYFIGLM